MCGERANKYVEKGVALQGAFGIGRNGDTGGARLRIYFGKRLGSSSERQLGAGK